MSNYIWFDKNALSQLAIDDALLLNSFGKTIASFQRDDVRKKSIKSQVYSDMTWLRSLQQEDITCDSNKERDANPNLYEGGIIELPLKKDPKRGQSDVRKYTIKIINKDNPQTGIHHDSIVEWYKRQNVKLAKLRHINVLKNLMLFENGNKFYILREYAEGGSISDLLNVQGFLPEEYANKYFKQAITAVCYMHSKGVIHGNINCQNIFIDSNDNIKLSDIRVGGTSILRKSKLINDGPLYFSAPELSKRKFEMCRTKLLSDSEEVLKHVMKNVCRLSFNKYVYCVSDVWSLGVVLFAMLWGQMPFTNKDYVDIVAGLPVPPAPRLPLKGGALSVSSGAVSLYSRMLEPNMARRLRPLEVLNDDWTQSSHTSYRDVQTDKFHKAWQEICEFVPQEYIIEEKLDQYNLAALRMNNYFPRDIIDQKEEFYTTLAFGDIQGDGCLVGFHDHIFSEKQQTLLKSRIMGLKVIPAPTIPIITPSRDNPQSKVILIQSDLFPKEESFNTTKPLHPSKVLRKKQLFYAVLYRLVGGKPSISTPKHALLYIDPSLIRGSDADKTNKHVPKSIYDTNIWKYLLTIVNEEPHFTEEYDRVAAYIHREIKR